MFHALVIARGAASGGSCGGAVPGSTGGGFGWTGSAVPEAVPVPAPVGCASCEHALPEAITATNEAANRVRRERAAMRGAYRESRVLRIVALFLAVRLHRVRALEHEPPVGAEHAHALVVAEQHDLAVGRDHDALLAADHATLAPIVGDLIDVLAVGRHPHDHAPLRIAAHLAAHVQVAGGVGPDAVVVGL